MAVRWNWIKYKKQIHTTNDEIHENKNHIVNGRFVALTCNKVPIFKEKQHQPNWFP